MALLCKATRVYLSKQILPTIKLQVVSLEPVLDCLLAKCCSLWILCSKHLREPLYGSTLDPLLSKLPHQFSVNSIRKEFAKASLILKMELPELLA